MPILRGPEPALSIRYTPRKAERTHDPHRTQYGSSTTQLWHISTWTTHITVLRTRHTSTIQLSLDSIEEPAPSLRTTQSQSLSLSPSLISASSQLSLDLSDQSENAYHQREWERQGKSRRPSGFLSLFFGSLTSLATAGDTHAGVLESVYTTGGSSGRTADGVAPWETLGGETLPGGSHEHYCHPHSLRCTSYVYCSRAQTLAGPSAKILAAAGGEKYSVTVCGWSLFDIVACRECTVCVRKFERPLGAGSRLWDRQGSQRTSGFSTAFDGIIKIRRHLNFKVRLWEVPVDLTARECWGS